MKTEYAGIHIPAGCTMYAGPSVDELKDLGVIPEETDSQIEITYDTARIQGSKGFLPDLFKLFFHAISLLLTKK